MLSRSVCLIARYSLLLIALLLFSGCPAPHKRPMHLTQVPSTGLLPPPPLQDPLPEPSKPIFEPVTPLGLPHEELAPQHSTFQPSPPVAAAPFQGLSLPLGMVPLPDWCQLAGFHDVRITRTAFPQSVDLHGPAGVLSLTVGHRYAKWNGIHISLGFPAALQGAHMALHSLDINKNIHPLAMGVTPWKQSGRVLVLDPGHGGPNPGAKVIDRNIWEKDLALDWALRIEKLLENSGWRVILTRRDDRDISLIDRVAIADAHQAHLFISLHFNALPGSGTRTESGIETYCLTPAGMPSNIHRPGFVDDPRQSFPNNAFDAENLILAARMHDSLVKGTDRPDRGVRRARFMTVLREQRRPAVLLEGGFLSNPEEARLILEPAFRQQLAEAVCYALVN